METEGFSPKKALLITRLIFISMFAACLIFAVLVFKIRTGNYFFKIDSLAPFTLSPLILFCVVIPVAFFYTKSLSGKKGSKNSLMDKFPLYQKILIVRLASCEGVVLYSLVFLLITGNLFGILVSIAALFVMWTYFPNVDKISSLLNLTQSEIEQFQ